MMTSFIEKCSADPEYRDSVRKFKEAHDTPSLRMQEVEEIQDKIVEIFVEHKIIGCCLIASILLREIMKKRGFNNPIIVEGWMITGSKFISRHYWIQYGPFNLDLGTRIFNKQLPLTFATPDIELSPVFVPRFERIDNETFGERATLAALEKGFELYRTKGLRRYLRSCYDFVQGFAKEMGIL